MCERTLPIRLGWVDRKVPFEVNDQSRYSSSSEIKLGRTFFKIVIAIVSILNNSVPLIVAFYFIPYLQGQEGLI